MQKLDGQQRELLRAIAEDRDYTPEVEDAQALFELVKAGFVRDHFQATDRGAAYAVVDCYASFMLYLNKYPNRKAVFYETAENLKVKLGKDNVDQWFRCVCQACLTLDLFNQYNYFIGGPELIETGRLQELNLSALYLALKKTELNRDALASLFLPPNVPKGSTENLELFLEAYIPPSVKAIAR